MQRFRKNCGSEGTPGGGLWEPRVERGLQGPGGPGVSFWAVMGVGIELDVSDG